MFCKKFQAVVTTVDEHGNMLVTRTRCKQWTCSYCAQVNRKQWNARLIDHINKKGGKWGWFTLTAHSNKRGEFKSIKNLRDAWGTLRKRMKRKYGKFDYCRVYEPHKDGSYHLHCIVSFHFDDLVTRKSKDGKNVSYSKWLSKTAKELAIGWYTHADNVDKNHHGGYVASYISKYITKLSVKEKSEIGRIRHIQCSQSWAKLTDEKKYSWKLATGVYEKDLDDIIEKGGNILDIQTGLSLSYDNFIDTYVYPAEFDAGDIFERIRKEQKDE